MKDKIVQTLIVVGILVGFVAFIAVEWNYIGKIIFALIFVPFYFCLACGSLFLLRQLLSFFCKRL